MTAIMYMIRYFVSLCGFVNYLHSGIKLNLNKKFCIAIMVNFLLKHDHFNIL